MSEPNETAKTSEASVPTLADAIREAKNAAADRDDVVVEMREAQRMRIEMFVQELQPVLSDIPEDDDLFDFAISSGTQPRFWVDAVAHVAMGRDRRTYRFVKDTRLGRVVLAESAEIEPVAEQVTRYIAGRIVERERILEGDRLPVSHDDSSETDAPAARSSANKAAARSETRTGLWLLFIGAVIGTAGFLAWYWDRLPIAGFTQ